MLENSTVTLFTPDWSALETGGFATGAIPSELTVVTGLSSIDQTLSLNLVPDVCTRVPLLVKKTKAAEFSSHNYASIEQITAGYRAMTLSRIWPGVHTVEELDLRVS